MAVGVHAQLDVVAMAQFPELKPVTLENLVTELDEDAALAQQEALCVCRGGIADGS